MHQPGCLTCSARRARGFVSSSRSVSRSLFTMTARGEWRLLRVLIYTLDNMRSMLFPHHSPFFSLTFCSTSCQLQFDFASFFSTVYPSHIASPELPAQYSLHDSAFRSSRFVSDVCCCGTSCPRTRSHPRTRASYQHCPAHNTQSTRQRPRLTCPPADSLSTSIEKSHSTQRADKIRERTSRDGRQERGGSSGRSKSHRTMADRQDHWKGCKWYV